MNAIHEERIRYLGLLSAADQLLLDAAVATDNGKEETRCDRALQKAQEAVAHLQMAVMARDTLVNGLPLYRAIEAHDKEAVDAHA